MRVEEKLNESEDLQASLDALHRDVYANNMAPYWVVDRSVAHDEDRQVQQGRKAVPFIWKYKRQIQHAEIHRVVVTLIAVVVPGVMRRQHQITRPEHDVLALDPGEILLSRQAQSNGIG